MAMFGEPKKKSGFDWTGALVNAFSSEAGQMYQKKKAGRAEAEQERQILNGVYESLKSEGLPEHAIKGFMSDPKNVSQYFLEKFKSREFGAAGGSVAGYDAKTGQMGTSYVAPSRHEFQGSVYDVSGGDPTGKRQVTPIHEGTQWVTPQPGTTAFGVNSFSGMPRVGGMSESGAIPQPGAVVADPRKGGQQGAPLTGGFPPIGRYPRY